MSMNICKISFAAVANVCAKHFRITSASPFTVRGMGATRERRAFLGLRDPETEKTLDELLKEDEAKSFFMESVDISLPLHRKARRRLLPREMQSKRDKFNKEIAGEALPKQDLDEIHAQWLSESSSTHIFHAAQHYQIYQHLFGEAFFYPRVPLLAEYSGDQLCTVHRGNVLHPALMQSEPKVAWPSADDSHWLLVMTSPDAHLSDNSAELLHWAVGNIRGSDITSGDVLTPYLPPLPPQGAGFHRYVLVLYRQSEKLDYTDWPQAQGLSGRTFHTRDMYSVRQDHLTPAGLAFCQAEWDSSVRHYFHHVLDRPEPIFTFIQPERFRPPQEIVPHKHPFDIYLNMYRDRKDIGEQVLKERLAEGTGPRRKARYPALAWLPRDMPTWLQDQRRDRMHGRGIYVLDRHLE